MEEKTPAKVNDLDSLVPLEKDWGAKFRAERKAWREAYPCRTAPLTQDQLNELRQEYFDRMVSRRLDVARIHEVASFGTLLGVWPDRDEALLFLIKQPA